MVLIPAGKFEMGRAHKLADDGLKWMPVLVQDDKPIRILTLDAYYLDRHEVTNEAYAAYAADAGVEPPYHWGGAKPPEGRERQPVANVNWQEAVDYCVSQGKRLPTEAEWERAARGGVTGAKYPWGDQEPDEKAKEDEEPKPELARFGAFDGPADVCDYPENAFGLCDMAGNVWEWTADWYARRAYDTLAAENPTGPETGIYRVLRGGSWSDVAKYLTNSYRSYARPDERSPNIGFRCAMNASKK